MIIHVLLVKMRPNLSSAEEQEFQEAIGSLATVPGVGNFSWGADVSGRSQGYTHAAVMHFESRDSLGAYLEHEHHKRIVETLNRLGPDRLIVDYTS